MTKDQNETAVCRGCGRKLNGKPYYMGGAAYHPETGERCKVNHYGGFVCSRQCDKRASHELENSMPGGYSPNLSAPAQLARLRSLLTTFVLVLYSSTIL
jgi:hypothetical protein